MNEHIKKMATTISFLIQCKFKGWMDLIMGVKEQVRFCLFIKQTKDIVNITKIHYLFI